MGERTSSVNGAANRLGGTEDLLHGCESRTLAVTRVNEQVRVRTSSEVLGEGLEAHGAGDLDDAVDRKSVV